MDLREFVTYRSFISNSMENGARLYLSGFKGPHNPIPMEGCCGFPLPHAGLLSIYSQLPRRSFMMENMMKPSPYEIEDSGFSSFWFEDLKNVKNERMVTENVARENAKPTFVTNEVMAEDIFSSQSGRVESKPVVPSVPPVRTPRTCKAEGLASDVKWRFGKLGNKGNGDGSKPSKRQSIPSQLSYKSMSVSTVLIDGKFTGFF
jgi:hypothetical protein